MWYYVYNVIPHFELRNNPQTFSVPVFFGSHAMFKWMKNYEHWNGYVTRSRQRNPCRNFVVSKELLKKQPSANKNYKCTASVLGDMKHSDWIKVK